MALTDHDFEAIRQTVKRTLSGLPPVDVDTALFTVLTVEARDPEWLLAQLADHSYPLAGRIDVLYNTSAIFQRALEILRREDPGLGQIRRTQES